jgi:hypothetical protein
MISAVGVIRWGCFLLNVDQSIAVVTAPFAFHFDPDAA